MFRPRLPFLVVATALAGWLTTGCSDSDDGPTTPAPVGEVLADFNLPDVNPTSATFDQAVSPRDYLAKVSAWYFGHAT